MPSKIYGKYRSRRKPKKGGGLLGDIGSGISTISKFVKDSGKKVTDVAQTVAGVGGDVINFVGDQISDKKVKKGFHDVGNFSKKTAKNIVKGLGDAAPYLGAAGEWVGNKMVSMDSDYTETGGSLVPHASLFEQMAFKNNNHAAHMIKLLGPDHHHAIRSAARYISNMPATVQDLPIFHHRPVRSVGLSHFQKIASSTHDSLQDMLKNDKRNLLHHALQSSVYSATIAGGHDFHPDRYAHNSVHEHIHKGGSFWTHFADAVGKRIGSASQIAGKAGLIAAPILSVAGLPELGLPLMAVSGATLAAGNAISEQYK